VPTSSTSAAKPPQAADPEARIRALSALLDRVIGRNQELVREVAALKRRIAVLERRKTKRKPGT
jgi:hypothetical protein